VNDVKARLEAIAQTQGKRLAKLLHKLDEAATKTIAAETGGNTSEPSHHESFRPSHLDSAKSSHLDTKAKFAQTDLSPLNWLLIAAASAGAVAALLIVVGFESLDNRGAAIAPLKERLTILEKRLVSTENAEAGLADRVAATESSLAKSTSLTSSTMAEIQKIQSVIAAQHASAPGAPAAGLSDLGRLEKRVAALENQSASGAALAEASAASVSAPSESGQGEAAFPPFDPVNFTPMLIWLTLSFGLLYLLMSKIALPRVENILNTRAAKISKDISEANVLRAKAEEAATAHEKTIADARAKALALAQETHARLNADTEAKRHALEAELNAKLAASEAQVLATKAKAMSNVGAIATETAAAIVQHITGKPADQNAIAKAIATIKA